MKAPAIPVLVALVLSLLAGFAGAPLTREQALQDIAKPAAQVRGQALLRLAEVGIMADTPVLVRALRDEEAGVRALAEHALWEIWSRSSDPAVDKLFRQGVGQMNRGSNQAAIATFSRIIARKPAFAEGWNKRATIYFIVGEYRKSLKDCDEVIKRNPYHFGALSGYGQIYLKLNQPQRALEYFRRALELNPNLPGVAAAVEQLEHLIAQGRGRSI
jgi:tetratricopeptide (TPR) repeat protein